MAEQYGGVGHSALHNWTVTDPDKVPTRVAPCCVWGLAGWEGKDESGWPLDDLTELTTDRQNQVRRSWAAREALWAVALHGPVSDAVFTAVERNDMKFRLPFDVWAERLGVVRV